jgi:hypothetical protein
LEPSERRLATDDRPFLFRIIQLAGAPENAGFSA